MGSYAAVVRQTLLLAAAMTIIVFAAPAEAKPWCGLCAGIAIILFLSVALWRHAAVRRLSARIDEVLHSGRAVAFEKCREGDLAVLTNEVEKMVARLSRMADQLQQERNALADSLADVSHQIRTPLTAVELMLPAIERMDDPLERKRAMREIEELLERIAWLVTTLLKIAKVDAGAIRAQTAPVSARAMIERAAAPLEAAFDLHDVRLRIESDDAATFMGDEMWTAEALENILKNCMEHTPAGGSVTIRAAENALATTFTITDTGPGIAADDLPHIFDRFYRGTATAETPAPEGFGIGLALAQALISVQGGTLRAANAPEGGAQFQIAFPKLVV
ncbi:sensor histidine kinase [Adlercreutzia murintestinalis]|uniref:sensor histidine kinase n=1 Tax=Adlercreutzia murintestinalis TaxID=2941325 RepID=UPI00203C5A00|nr:HAMP domain-containing sensor histidine kinase [Adlercreutzia murintestinalis]